MGTLPVYYDYANSGRAGVEAGYVADNGTIVFGHAYVIGDPRPLYPFGYGLSHSKFTYGNVSPSATNVSTSNFVTTTVTMTNEG